MLLNVVSHHYTRSRIKEGKAANPLTSCSKGFQGSTKGLLGLNIWHLESRSLGWGFLLFLLKPELWLPTPTQQGQGAALRCFTVTDSSSFNKIHPTSLSCQNVGWFLISARLTQFQDNIKKTTKKNTLPIFYTCLDFERQHILNK